MEWIDLENNHEDEECLKNLDENGICKMCGKDMIARIRQLKATIIAFHGENSQLRIQRNIFMK